MNPCDWRSQRVKSSSPSRSRSMTETPWRQQVVQSCRYADVRQGCHQTSVASGFFVEHLQEALESSMESSKIRGNSWHLQEMGGVACIFPPTKCKKWKNVLKPMRNSMFFFWEKLCISSEFFKAHGKNHGREPNQSQNTQLLSIVLPSYHVLPLSIGARFTHLTTVKHCIPFASEMILGSSTRAHHISPSDEHFANSNFLSFWWLYTILVGGFNPSEKYQSVGATIPSIWKIKNVPNHQHIYYIYT